VPDDKRRRSVSTAVVPVALTRYNTDERLTRVTPEFCRRTIREVEKLQKEFRKTLGVTFAFLGDEIYVKAGMDVPSRRHYGNYPQIEDGVGMIRSFLNSFEKLLVRTASGSDRVPSFLSEPPALTGGGALINHKMSIRTHPAAMVPQRFEKIDFRPPANAGGSALFGTILTGEMFAPILATQIEKYNELTGAKIKVIAVPNTYFGGDVSVAGLLTAQDLIAVKDQVVGDFVIIPTATIKSDEPIFLDGVSYETLKQKFDVPIYDVDTSGLINFLEKRQKHDR
jgi:NifB/MoaA-like Fe-S oxidoreductase